MTPAGFNIAPADYRRDLAAQPERRVLKPTMTHDDGSNAGPWITVPFILTRDDKGWHDAPADTETRSSK